MVADNGFAVRATPAAAAAIDGLRGAARKRYESFEGELRKQGCKVAGYRLLGAEEGEHSEFCCKRLIADWRVIATFEPGVAIVVAIGRHDDHAFYADLATALEIGAVGQRREEKPACCGKDGWPSVGSIPGKRKPSAKSPGP